MKLNSTQRNRMRLVNGVGYTWRELSDVDYSECSAAAKHPHPHPHSGSTYRGLACAPCKEHAYLY